VPDQLAPDDHSPDDLGPQLRAGAARFAADLSPGPASLVRARGDQRRHRKLAGSLALAFVLIAGGGGTAYALGQHAPRPASPLAPVTSGPPAPTTAPTATPPASTHSPGPAGSPGGTATSPGAGRSTGSAGAAATTRTIRLGSLTLRVPALWHVTYQDAQGDYTVSTTPCNGDDLIGGEQGSTCPSFSLIAGAGPTSSPSGAGPHAYVPGQEYTTSTGATGCPAKPHPGWLRDAAARPASSGYAPVTSTRTADYTVWRLGCYDAAGTPSVFFQQRDWYLPDSRILIVDEYSIPGLAQILATATWAG
jgi:hypothetical protein